MAVAIFRADELVDGQARRHGLQCRGGPASDQLTFVPESAPAYTKGDCCRNRTRWTRGFPFCTWRQPTTALLLRELYGEAANCSKKMASWSTESSCLSSFGKRSCRSLSQNSCFSSSSQYLTRLREYEAHANEVKPRGLVRVRLHELVGCIAAKSSALQKDNLETGLTGGGHQAALMKFQPWRQLPEPWCSLRMLRLDLTALALAIA